MKWYNPWTWFPYGRSGRQTLLYIVLALCGPALTGCLLWILRVVETFPDTTGEQRLEAYVDLSKPLGWALLIIVVALACFVSIRAVKIGPLEASSREDPVDPPQEIEEGNGNG